MRNSTIDPTEKANFRHYKRFGFFDTFGQRAVEYAQDYAWEKIANQIVKVYEELLTPK